MKTVLLVLVSVAMAVAVTENPKSIEDLKKKEKRGVAIFGVPGYDVFGGSAAFGSAGWGPTGFSTGGWASPESALGQIQLQATHNIALQALRNPTGTPSIAYSPEVVQAIHQAKEASQNVHIAQQRVSEAKQAALLQQKIALAKEANAREAAHRTEEILANAQAEARSSARQLVASQQRLATLKDAVAAAQRVAAARETAAAAAIQRTASATAAELRKQDVDKQISQSEEEARQKDIVAAKENAIANALHHVAVAEKPSYAPWG